MSRRTITRARPGAPADAAAPEPSTPSPAPESPTIDPRVAELEGLRAQDAETIANLRAQLDAAVAETLATIAARDAASTARDNAVAARDAAFADMRRMGAERAELEQRFQRDWDRREKEVEAMLIRSGRPDAAPATLPETAPVKGKVVRATCRLRALNRAGEPVTIEPLHPIPADVDLSTLDRGTFEEV